MIIFKGKSKSPGNCHMETLAASWFPQEAIQPCRQIRWCSCRCRFHFGTPSRTAFSCSHREHPGKLENMPASSIPDILIPCIPLWCTAECRCCTSSCLAGDWAGDTLRSGHCISTMSNNPIPLCIFPSHRRERSGKSLHCSRDLD